VVSAFFPPVVSRYMPYIKTTARIARSMTGICPRASGHGVVGPKSARSLPGWAALGPRLIRTVELVDPSRPVHSVVRLDNDHGA
jgi:hypothetical protein